jgi:hypothetical protein
LRSGLLDDSALTRIVMTARVVARLNALQLEELDHEHAVICEYAHARLW